MGASVARDPILLLPLFKEGGLGQIDLNELDVRELANRGHAAEHSIQAAFAAGMVWTEKTELMHF